MRSDGRERTPHLALVSRPEREGNEAETREADVDLVQLELERLRDRSCLLLVIFATAPSQQVRGSAS
jgi:hypothetical protein